MACANHASCIFHMIVFQLSKSMSKSSCHTKFRYVIISTFRPILWVIYNSSNCLRSGDDMTLSIMANILVSSMRGSYLLKYYINCNIVTRTDKKQDM